MPVYADPVDGHALAPKRLETWTARLIERLGAPADIASDVAVLLLASDRRGIASHGTARLPQYVALVEAGVLDPTARPAVLRRRAAIALLDARNGWGHHASRVAVDMAIEGAREAGSFTAVVRRSNHYGIAGWYAIRAAEAGLIGISLTNSSPLVAPTRARRPMLGTNPIAVAAPAGRHGIMCLDMATSTIPRGRIEVAARRGEPLRAGWAIDRDGRPALTPEAALAGALQPLGGAEETGGYKGYGLGLVVDLLTGILAGARLRPGDRAALLDARRRGGPRPDLHRDRPRGHRRGGCIRGPPGGRPRPARGRADDPDAPGRVLVPGEPEAAAERRADEVGVVIDAEHHAALAALAARFDLPLPEATAVHSDKGQ